MPDPASHPNDAHPSRRPRKGPRKPRKLTRDYLERAALAYLGRYDSTERNLRLVLRRKAKRRLDAHDAGDDARRDAERWVDELVDKAVANGLVDDRRYAEGLMRRLQRRGTSHRASWAKLREKGVSGEVAEELLGRSGNADGELAAAAAYARRRGLGPFRRDPEAREARRERDMGSLARAGFGVDTARRVLDAASPDELPDRRGGGLFD